MSHVQRANVVITKISSSFSARTAMFSILTYDPWSPHHNSYAPVVLASTRTIYTQKRRGIHRSNDSRCYLYSSRFKELKDYSLIIRVWAHERFSIHEDESKQIYLSVFIPVDIVSLESRTWDGKILRWSCKVIYYYGCTRNHKFAVHESLGRFCGSSKSPRTVLTSNILRIHVLPTP